MSEFGGVKPSEAVILGVQAGDGMSLVVRKELQW